ncbi:uncharacterized protein LOC101898417 [Musca domestica]|uniref:Uncharacterized protein LOC101898417 n=1 Tax=Musca domestica TaxID=7370 RepID=A0A9J7DCA8_MUSDO|nr:uncharacterized protein LOC101898417 [Musca domestica]
MSYLVTEIALEMLGYTFYDIYGVPEDINNFRSLAATDRSNDGALKEPHLATILGLDANTSKRNNNNPPTAAVNTIEATKIKLPELLAKLTDVEIGKVKEQVLRNKPSLSGENPGETKSNQQQAISNLLDLEHQKLISEQQSLRNFRRFIEKNLMQFNPTCFERYLEAFKGT